MSNSTSVGFWKAIRLLLGAAAMAWFLVQAGCGSGTTPHSVPSPEPPVTARSTPTRVSPPPTLHGDPTLQEIRGIEKALNTTDLEIQISHSPDPAVAGQGLLYTWTVTNHGPNPADYVRAWTSLPQGVLYQSDSAACTLDPPSSLICDIGYLSAGESRDILIAALIDADLPLNESRPTHLINAASVSNIAGPNHLPYLPFDHVWPDSDVGNNGASEELLVIGLSDEVLTTLVPPMILVEPLHLQESYNTTDVSLYMDGSPYLAVAGLDMSYKFTVFNGFNPARDLRMIVTLPPGVVYQWDTAGCVEGPSLTLTCDLGSLRIQERAVFTVRVLIDEDLVVRSGGPTEITARATVENLAGPDPDWTNNAAVWDTLINENTRYRNRSRN